ncbi:MAG: response regulator transcription factor [Actinomycetota bacterium]|jgi:two-component system OmpR family response regulator
MAALRILVADDDEAICDTIEDALHLAGYLTMRARDGQMALDRVRSDRPDLVILDVNMPKLDGFEVLRKMRSLSITTPAILLTARHEREDAITGLKLGADDYVKKPFGLEELLLRVAAVLRRVNGESDSALVCGTISLSVARHEVVCAENDIDLSPTEFRLLEYLMENKNRVLTKQQILDAVWGIDFDSSTTVVETFISYLRKKMSPEIDNMLVTVRGIGFKLVDKA